MRKYARKLYSALLAVTTASACYLSSAVFATVPATPDHSSETMSVKLSKTPERVVALEFGLLDDLLAIGVKPVGIADNKTTEGSNPAYLIPQTKGIESVGTRQQPDLEKIMSLQPDLIIADHFFQDAITDKLQKIAPTLVMSGNLATPEQQMDNIRTLGKTFHKEQEAKAVVTKFTNYYEDLQEEGGKHPATVMVGFALPNGMFRGITENSILTGMLTALGKKNLVTQYAASQAIPMTVENVLVKDPDAIVLLLSDTRDGKAVAKKLTENPLWSSLKAVKNHHVYIGSRNLWAIDHGVESMTLMLEQAKESGFLTMKPHKLDLTHTSS